MNIIGSQLIKIIAVFMIIAIVVIMFDHGEEE